MEAAILYTDCTVLLDLKWHPRRWDEPRRPIYSDIQIFRYSDIQIFRYSEKEKESGVVGSCSQRKKKLREGILDMHLPPVSETCHQSPDSSAF